MHCKCVYTYNVQRKREQMYQMLSSSEPRWRVCALDLLVNFCFFKFFSKMKNEMKEVVWNLFTGNKKQDVWTYRWKFVRPFVTFFPDLKNWVIKDPHWAPPPQDGRVRVSSELRHLVGCGENKTTHAVTLGDAKELSPWQKENYTQMYRTDFWTLWEKARVGCFRRTAWKHVYYLGWNRSPAQAGCMRQVLGPGALGRPKGSGGEGGGIGDRDGEYM